MDGGGSGGGVGAGVVVVGGGGGVDVIVVGVFWLRHGVHGAKGINAAPFAWEE